MQIAVSLSGLEKSFTAGDTKSTVLKGIDLAIPAEEITFVTGPSGCGKTTLISIIAGILTPDSGTVSIFDTPIVSKSRESTKFRLANIGFIFQQHNLVPTLTAAENASIPLLIRRVPQRQARQKAIAMLNEVGLGDRIDHLPSQLSGGQQQRVAIARALVGQPRLIICDEPTASLDAENGFHIMSLLKQLAVESDRTVIVVTHDSRIYQFADSIVEMEDGQVVRVELQQKQLHKNKSRGD